MATMMPVRVWWCSSPLPTLDATKLQSRIPGEVDRSALCLLDGTLGLRKEELPGPAPRPGGTAGSAPAPAFSELLALPGSYSHHLITATRVFTHPSARLLETRAQLLHLRIPNTQSGDPTHLLNTKCYIVWAPASIRGAPVLALGGASQVRAPPSASIQVRQTRLLSPQPCSRRIWGDSDPSFPRRHFLSPWGPSQFAHIMIPSFQQKPNTGDKRPVALPVYAHRFKIAQRSSRSGAREHAE